MKVKREVKLALTAIAAVVILIWGINFLKAKALCFMVFMTGWMD